MIQELVVISGKGKTGKTSVQGLAVVESDGPAAEDFRHVWYCLGL
jgi:MinD superfamily P-loop ATPase